MRYRTFGRTGWQVSEVGYGMWGMAGWTGSNDEDSLRALDRAFALGCNFFDTAWAYGGGKSEQLLGQALKKRGPHGDPIVRVATKIPPKNMKWPGKAEYPIADTYRLEVSSPGIDRPLTRARDFADWAGHEARLSLAAKLEGRKQLAGTLKGLDGDDVLIDVPGLGERRVPRAALHSAKLILTDRLIAATAPLSADGADTIEHESQDQGQD